MKLTSCQMLLGYVFGVANSCVLTIRNSSDLPRVGYSLCQTHQMKNYGTTVGMMREGTWVWRVFMCVRVRSLVRSICNAICDW